MAAATKASGGRLPAAQMRSERRALHGHARSKKGRCSRIGRGQIVANRLRLEVEGRPAEARMRRVVIKARMVRLKSGSKAAAAHIRYLERDGTTRDGER
jgi:hypothetical protein